MDDATERLAKLEHQLQAAHAELESMNVEDTDEHAVADLEERLERIHRRTLSARVRVKTARAELEALLQKQ